MGKLIKKKTPEQRKKAREKLASSGGNSGEGANGNLPAAGGERPARVPARAPSVPRDDTPRGPKFWVTTVQFLREVKVELKKVTWPSRKQAIGSTIVVLVFVAILSLYLGATDFSLSYIVKLVLG